MVIFTRVKYQNFFAAGNAPIELDLNNHSSSLIVGKNGSGKSTMSEAICFALFGRPLRKVNKPKLVNSINGRDCLVELEFRVGTQSYRIKRGIKPNVFEIYENGKLLPQPASIDDYQHMLESNILHLNYKSFMQVVVLGSASYVPFMRLSTGARRDIIEDLLDIEVFSAMNALTKDELTTIRNEIEKCAQAQHLIGEQRKMAETFTAQLEEERAANIEHMRKLIEQEETSITRDVQEVERLTEELKKFDAVRATLDMALNKRREYEKTLDAIDSRAKKMRKERTFYEQHDNCPTCEQSITEEFKAARFESLTKKESDAQKAASQCQHLIDKYQTQVASAEAELEDAEVLRTALRKLETAIGLYRRRIEELEAQIASVEKTTRASKPSVDVADLETELTKLQEKHADMSAKRVIMDAATMLLKDNGIKARIIKHYLPIINRTINTYLNAMDFPILFTLDEEFNEIIKSRHRDEFTYDSFSEGEKKRIDLALLLTWRHVASIKNSAATNLLILDEVFDSSLDSAGTEEFLKIIASLEKDANVWVISHKTDQLVDKFSNIVVFEKTRGFSQLKSA